jgi:hypothetical protein
MLPHTSIHRTFGWLAAGTFCFAFISLPSSWQCMAARLRRGGGRR